MSLRSANRKYDYQNLFDRNKIVPNSYTVYDHSTKLEWRRNPNWIPMPTFTEGEEKVCILAFVHKNFNGVSVKISGAYTIDWGDGSSPENYTTGFTSNHIYDFNDPNISSDMGDVSFVSNYVQRTAHGYENNYNVRFSSIDTTTGIETDVDYYVVNASTDSFQISETVSGTPLTFTDGTGKILWYKQVIITITPQSGQNITYVDVSTRHPYNAASYPTAHWLEIVMSVPNLGSTSLYVYQSNGNRPFYLESFTSLSDNSLSTIANAFSYSNIHYFSMAETNVTNAAAAFASCMMASITLDIHSQYNNCYYMFNGCPSLLEAPYFDTSQVVGTPAGANGMRGMFYSCVSLEKVPLYDTSSSTNMYQMFYGCYSLQEVPLFDTSSLQHAYAMFQNCNSLRVIPPFNFISCTNISTFASGCSSLISCYLTNTQNITDISSAFTNCFSLRNLSNLSFERVVTSTNAFVNCYSLTEFQDIYMPSCTTCLSMFSSCVGLIHVGDVYLPLATASTSLFTSCYSLRTVGDVYIPQATATTQMFQGCYSLEGVSSITTSIALTLTNNMFYSCYSLRTAPYFETSSVTNMASMFYYCYSLKDVPAYDTSNNTTMISMFYYCYSLEHLPSWNTSKVKDFTNAFTLCNSLLRYPNYDFSNASTMASTFSSCFRINSIFDKNVYTPSTISIDSNYRLREVKTDISQGQTLSVANPFSLYNVELGSLKTTLSLQNSIVDKDCANILMDNLSNVYAARTLTLTNSVAGYGSFTRTCGVTTGSRTVTCTNTSGITEGMTITGTGIAQTTDKTVSISASTNTINLTSHGFADGCPIIIRHNTPKYTVVTGFATNGSNIAYGNGTWVYILGSSSFPRGEVYTSTDGITWGLATTMTSRNWVGLKYLNGYFIVLAGNSNVVAVSTDGVSWTEHTLPATARWYNITYGNGRYIAIAGGYVNTTAYTSNIFAYCDDIGEPTNWSQGTMPATSSWQDIAFGNGYFVVINNVANNAVYRSVDGSTWESCAFTWASPNYPSLTFYDNHFSICEGQSTVKSTWFYSRDGYAWASRTNDTTGYNNSIVSDGTTHIMSNGDGTYQLRYSQDGYYWVKGVTSYTPRYNGAHDSNGTFIFTGISNNKDSGYNSLQVIQPQKNIGYCPTQTYYVINSTTNDFQISDSVTGSPIEFDYDTTDVVIRAGYKVLSIIENTSFELTAPATSTATTTYTLRELNITPALCKGWTITGA